MGKFIRISRITNLQESSDFLESIESPKLVDSLELAKSANLQESSDLSESPNSEEF
jgi:hypothetical protein